MEIKLTHPCCTSPLGVMLLMEAHFRPEPIGNGSVADREMTAHLVKCGLIAPVQNGQLGEYRTTDKGKFHVKALCNLPFPEALSVWVTPKHD